MSDRPTFRVAILDLYNGEPNQGMRCIDDILRQFGERHHVQVHAEVFDLRRKAQMADLSFDAYISTGGPGSPIDSEGSEWEQRYFEGMDALREWNANHPEHLKPVFLICHSFQIYMRHYQLGKVSKRKSTSFGVMPVHRTAAGVYEPYFQGLDDPFWAVDSRDWQVTQPDLKRIREHGGDVLCIEKYRPHVRLERCVMAMRFDEATFGTQFHPEADPVGMAFWLRTEEKNQQVIAQHGEEKYQAMLDHLDDDDKIILTHNSILPRFLNHALSQLQHAL